MQTFSYDFPVRLLPGDQRSPVELGARHLALFRPACGMVGGVRRRSRCLALWRLLGVLRVPRAVSRRRAERVRGAADVPRRPDRHRSRDRLAGSGVAGPARRRSAPARQIGRRCSPRRCVAAGLGDRDQDHGGAARRGRACWAAPGPRGMRSARSAAGWRPAGSPGRWPVGTPGTCATRSPTGGRSGPSAPVLAVTRSRTR